MSNAHQLHSGNGSTNGKHHAPREKADVVEQLEGLKSGGDKPHGNMPKDAGLMLTLMGVATVAMSVVCLYYSTVRTICIGLLLLALGSTLAKEGKREDARHQKLVTGLVMVPIVILAFLFKPAAQIIFIFSLQFGFALAVYGLLGERVLRFKNRAPYVIFVITLVVVLILNFQQLLNLLQRVAKP
jgi:uncharacterized membrane protein